MATRSTRSTSAASTLPCLRTGSVSLLKRSWAVHSRNCLYYLSDSAGAADGNQFNQSAKFNFT